MITSAELRSQLAGLAAIPPAERTPVDGAIVQFGNTLAAALEDREQRLAARAAPAPRPGKPEIHQPNPL